MRRGALAAAGWRARSEVTTPQVPLSSAGAPESYWIHWNSTSTTDGVIATEAARRKFVLLNAWEADYVTKIKAANPDCICLVYKDLSSTRDYAVSGGVDDADLPAGVGYADANTNHTSWFLLNSGGSRLEYDGYEGHWQMDVGNSGYQAKWIANVVANATAHGFDGVIADNALFTADAYHEGVVSPTYPTDAAMKAAYLSMLAAVQDGLHDAGLLFAANLTNMRTVPGTWNDYMAHLDGAWDEFWLSFSSADVLPDYDQGWNVQVAEIVDNEASGKFTLVQPHYTAGDTNVRRYTLASYLLGNGGRSGFVDVEVTDGYGDPSTWHPEYDFDLGAPVGPYYPVPSRSGCFRRDFTAGTAVVNANSTGSSSLSITLGGSYRNEAGSTVTSVSLAGTRGAILRTP